MAGKACEKTQGDGCSPPPAGRGLKEVSLSVIILMASLKWVYLSGSGGRVVRALAPAAPRSTLCGVVGSSTIAARSRGPPTTGGIGGL